MSAGGGSPPSLAGDLSSDLGDLAPNHGAHRLAWWLAAEGDRGVAMLERVWIEPATIDRMIDGTVIPAGDDALALARVTGGAVRPDDFDATPGAAWDVAPLQRPN